MEWFQGPKGLKFSEIGCRPPGVGCWDLYTASNDVDVYREWAHVITHGVPEHPMRRPYSAGIVALRPDANGQIQGYSGIDEIQGRSHEQAFGAIDQPQFWENLAAGQIQNGRFKLRGKNGREVWLFAGYAPPRRDSERRHHAHAPLVMLVGPRQCASHSAPSFQSGVD